MLMENRQTGIADFLASLPVAEGNTVGAAVMHCDPFTKGHRYLIETAAKETVDKETEIQQPDEEQVPAEESADAEAEDNAQEFSADVNANVDADEDITTLKTQIDELKFFFRNN